MKYLSLCIPTNGMVEWILPVLDRIYSQSVNMADFEVVVTDNGQEDALEEAISDYLEKYENLVYKRTKAELFFNQIEALKLAQGEYLKFVNHRSLLEPGILRYWINIVKRTQKEKPILYFSNGVLGFDKPRKYKSFDGFVRTLREYSSWTTGVGVWRRDFLTLPKDHKYNHISPHSDVLFHVRKDREYIIIDKRWSYEIEASHEKKGKYDFYKTFACDELAIVLGLYLDGDISAATFKSVRDAYERFVTKFYYSFNLQHEPCSYDLKGFKDNMGIFMSGNKVLFGAYKKLLKAKYWQVKRKLGKLGIINV